MLLFLHPYCFFLQFLRDLLYNKLVASFGFVNDDFELLLGRSLQLESYESPFLFQRHRCLPQTPIFYHSFNKPCINGSLLILYSGIVD
jgi:hypothetical protein